MLSYKFNYPVEINVPGHKKINLIALPNDDIKQREKETDLRYMTRVIKKAMGDDALDCLSVEQVGYIFRKFLKVQNDATPSAKKLKSDIIQKLHKSNEFKIDAMAIYESTSLHDYYGKPASQLHIGQIAFYYMVKQYYKDYVIDNKMVSKKWLEKSK